MRVSTVVFVGAITSLAMASDTTTPIVLDFEDLPSGLAPMPAGYAGFASWGSIAHSDLGDSNYVASSGDTFALSVGPHAPILFGTEYIFEGAYFSGPDQPYTLWFELYNEGELVHTSESLSPTPKPVFLASGYAGPVDEVRIGTSFANFYCFDDFTYSEVGGGGCNDADLVEPFGVLEFADVLAFLGAFAAMEPAADLVPTGGDGVWEFADVLHFLGEFAAGCP